MGTPDNAESRLTPIVSLSISSTLVIFDGRQRAIDKETVTRLVEEAVAREWPLSQLNGSDIFDWTYAHKGLWYMDDVLTVTGYAIGWYIAGSQQPQFRTAMNCVGQSVADDYCGYGADDTQVKLSVNYSEPEYEVFLPRRVRV